MKTVRTVIISDILATTVDIGRFHKKREGSMKNQPVYKKTRIGMTYIGRAWKSGTFAGLENRTVSEAQA